MFKAFVRGFTLIKRHFRPGNKPILGRWDTTSCDKSKNIKFVYANIDNCGDLICGEPLKNKVYVKKDL
tara:strand:- start:473 stop:676 length:204 start_codon:yes stop_codon:yes gene_type:complete